MRRGVAASSNAGERQRALGGRALVGGAALLGAALSCAPPPPPRESPDTAARLAPPAPPPTPCEAARERLARASADFAAGWIGRAGRSVQRALEQCPTAPGARELSAELEAATKPPFGEDVRDVDASAEPERDYARAAAAFIAGRWSEAGRVALAVARAESPLRAEALVMAARVAEAERDAARARRMFARAAVALFVKPQKHVVFFPADGPFSAAASRPGPRPSWFTCASEISADGKLVVEMGEDQAAFARAVPSRVLIDRIDASGTPSSYRFTCYAAGGRFRMRVTPAEGKERANVTLDELGVRSVSVEASAQLPLDPRTDILTEDGTAYFGYGLREDDRDSNPWFVADFDHAKPRRLALPKWVNVPIPVLGGELFAIEYAADKLHRFDAKTGRELGVTPVATIDGLRGVTMDGRLLAFSSGGDLQVVSTATGALERSFRQAQFSPRVTDAVVAGAEPLDDARGRVFFETDNARLTESGRHVVLLAREGAARALDLDTGAVTRFVMPAGLFHATISDDRRFGAGWNFGRFEVFEVRASGAPRKIFERSVKGSPVGADFLPGTSIAVMRSNDGQTASYAAVDAARGHEVPVPPASARRATRLEGDDAITKRKVGENCAFARPLSSGGAMAWCDDGVWSVPARADEAPRRLGALKRPHPMQGPSFDYDERHKLFTRVFGGDLQLFALEDDRVEYIEVRLAAETDGGVLADDKNAFAFFGTVTPAFRASLACGDAKMPIDVCAAMLEAPNMTLPAYLGGSRAYRDPP